MSARLSPAASLLRNSKLFALPPPIALPVAPPSSNEISHSDTATTPFPRFAAIETTEASGKLGDWGFKRPLPAKTLRNTNNPVVRLIRGIDTAEHVADFESAADHVLTLRKFSELHHPIKLEDVNDPNRISRDVNVGVFRSSFDNTTNLTSTAPFRTGHASFYGRASAAAIQDQLPPKLRRKEGVTKPMNTVETVVRKTNRSTLNPSVKRWRYNGPSLVSISGAEFDQYLRGIGEKEKALLYDRIREEVVSDKQRAARDLGDVQPVQFSKEDVTEQELQEYVRYLRDTPSVFGPMIAQILDLPNVKGQAKSEKDDERWEYGPSTLASEKWGITGTPATHPSAGLSYTPGTHAANHPRYGPQAISHPVVARAVKKVSRSARPVTNYGVAGFIMEANERSMILGRKPFEKTNGGMKGAVVPKTAFITADGTLKMSIEETTLFEILDDKAVTGAEMEEVNRAAQISAQAQGGREVQPAPQFSNANVVSRLNTATRRNDAQDELDLDQVLGRTSRRT